MVNSILKPNLQAFFEQVDIVILEEGQQVLEHLAIGTVLKPEKVYQKLKLLCEQAKTLIVSDADINDQMLKFAVESKPKQQLRFLHKKKLFSDKTITLSSYEQTLAEIKETAKGQSIMVCSDYKKELLSLEKYFKQNTKLSVLCITADEDKKDKKTLNFLSSPNDVLHQYDVTLYSPSITSSVSITNDKFKRHFGLFIGNVCSSTIIQMLRRNRPCQKYHIGLKAPFNRKRENIMLEPIKTEFGQLVENIKKAKEYNTRNIIPALYFEAKAHGFNVNINNTTNKPTIKQLMQYSKTLSEHDYMTGMLDNELIHKASLS